MAKYINKAAVSELKNLYEDIDKCIGDLVLARSKHDQRGISDAHWKMETLTVNTQQVLSYILQHLEVKEVDLLKEIANQYESNYEEYLTYEEFADIAKHFYELGLKSQKGKEV